MTRFLIFSLVCKNRGNTKNSVNMMDWGHYYMVSGQIMNQLSCSSYLWEKADPLFLPPHVTWLTDSSDTDYKQWICIGFGQKRLSCVLRGICVG